MRSIVIAAGGTGGHISPGVALAEVLTDLKERIGFENLYLFSLERNRNNPDLEQAPCPVLWHDLPPLSGNPLLFPFRYAYHLLRTFYIFKKLNVDTVIGMGGYSTVSSILYGILFKKKVYLCEQNTVPGNVNRLFFRFADKAAFSFPPKDPKIPCDWQVLGNPLRKKTIPKMSLKFSEKYDTKKKKQFNVLVMGGSQGARQINNIVLRLMGHEEINTQFRFRLLTGTALYEEVSQKTKKDKDAELISYSDNMKEHYEWANFVIARSGSGVLSECAAFALPMILIPYPYAKDDHQMANARYFELNGAAIVLDQKDEDESHLFRILDQMANNVSLLNDMSIRSLQCSHVDASKDTAKYFFSLD
ncbi:UDP-N-acetylglucosamine--N-acetylmuramyl-(pentapeptide) pyrophosphoryl-undecaprenol N-acetylglucosamine transferase [Leptospira ellisii]|uniref:UDP-N-acetylglucosamine--N-acetylmuramyl-(pentapeptide) pyrophosphoryl-undecaprenol N-acetylglucosamine transferase n=1 Tax=Leptospira ellisii TaxID=2023197 RepID=A0A2N0B6D0_9LEPT|nr:UDP-N-acetylglucosamine--N-acetylmuramyl-(pentapeptide) pyrophosphoryl-undecaprenol N-acetylglucosamine transferase [Leptospira ellisii]MDV6237303.1 UDP-N-acetylglucosamine--N-acetylmuramyl-(pentapeptide) pyrophosphoryl-undecaprenol N-acetylglucosamine transferase [Leptospira ellisii]PJZ92100.1 UDP-N-acetylglucosamine--N-acetylmuramyl-(pentapeptide) pyrophosphoryl-undecaprenol N-acetylglucosamine transferase [Leptospira ellisii]PKA04694.1 UDP-N-acetylglucosamine--N-acetylmuramyl-(pentapeptide